MVNFGNTPNTKQEDEKPSSVRVNGPSKKSSNISFKNYDEITEEELKEKEKKVKEENWNNMVKPHVVTNKPTGNAMDAIHREQREERARLNDMFNNKQVNSGTSISVTPTVSVISNVILTNMKPGQNKPFHTEADTKAEALCSVLLNAFPQFAGKEQYIKGMFKQLMGNDLSIVTSWGEDQIVEQRNLVSTASDRIREFNSLNGSELLSEVLNFSKEMNNNQGSFFKRITSKFSGNSETYNTRVTALRMQINALFPMFRKFSDQCKNSSLSLYLAVLSTADDESKNKEKLIAEAFYNRRMLLNGALTNMQMLTRQLDQTLEMVTNMLNEISHIMDVVLPALKMKV
jgi:hypothetical protein